MAQHDMDSGELESAHLEEKYAGHRQTVVSGDWLIADDSADPVRYQVGYEALVADADRWNGFAVPLVTRAVADRLCADQAKVNAEFEDSETWTFDGDTLVVTTAPGTDEEYVNRIAPVDGLYRLDVGYTFEDVDGDECDEVVR